ncbi:hypothetical protein [Serratia proteamaculans]|uniref:hypothetical protein n=1 Tax=Serratia proteamaculans TaxID=28151 RepID=UPI0039AF750C
MNSRYLDDNEVSNFPEEAFDMNLDVDGPLEFNNYWLESASIEDQLVAVKEWFLSRYCDPAQETPYNSREGGYLYIHGGPYSPDEEINERFSGVISDDVLQEVIAELEVEVGSEWAPIIRDYGYDDFDDYYESTIGTSSEPSAIYEKRISEIEQIIFKKSNDFTNSQLALQMCYSMIISSLEAYVSDVVIYWSKKDEKILFRIASKECKDREFKLADVLNDLEKFKDDVISHLSTNVIWHRLDKLKPVIEHGLGVKFPEIGKIMGSMQIRHDIVHRAGKTKGGEPLNITTDELNELKNNINEFVYKFEKNLSETYHHSSDEF